MSTVPVSTQPNPPRQSRTLLIVLVAVGGVLLLTVVALLFLLLGRGMNPAPVSGVSDTPTSTPTASATPTATPTQAAPQPDPQQPADTTPRFSSFSAVTEVQCPNSGDKPEIQFSWSTEYAVEVWYTSGHEDAKDDAYMQVPLAGNQGDLTDEHLFPCAHRETEDYTLTLVGPNGERVHQFWTVRDLNWGKDTSDEDD